MVIRSFADKKTEGLAGGQAPKGMPSELAPRAYRVLSRIAAATRIEDLRTPPSHRLHQLKGHMAGRWSVSVNMQYRVTFRFENGDAFDVKFEDYH
ncbi:MAG: type II toxin-antitoxin system RelE/ParE family toxin [Alphaproteobacteria bacterium]|nr:type II toxin-antitoxin system RelE/ParE family toxin [Alphaproteobacteria bacterium]